ncbi:hypothetical protein CPB84DRAFT_1852114 [Gymnopilus junonius]|uniref:Uncharacterized protein n=1 Tax=Gymnopilus junonius TaxID=109634 RepID=A0A9P5NDA0_GYMJU|nr:hypothetical protein CPB84DRAFT_1852114 [Gymnopilus junonius]
MEEVNPHLAKRSPRDAVSALKKQFQNYLDGMEPFNRKRSRRESLREYWCRLLNDEDSDVLAALAVKVFSAMPVSMVDERAMSVVTWLNSPGMDEKRAPRKPVTVNWRDIRKTIQQEPKTLSAKPVSDTSIEDSDSEDNDSKLNSPADPVEDPLKWLDDGLPDLSGFDNRNFDLALQYDIRRYVDILADSASETQERMESQIKSTSESRDVAASVLVPAAEEWTTW